jgi:hypothetical protein
MKAAIADYWERVRLLYRFKCVMGWKAWRLPPGLDASPGEILKILGEAFFILTFPVWWLLSLVTMPLEPFRHAFFCKTERVRKSLQKWEEDLAKDPKHE